MNDLEKKIYKYLDRQCVADDFKQKELRQEIANEILQDKIDDKNGESIKEEEDE